MAALSFFRIFQNRYTTAAMMRDPTPTPAPMPAFAPVDSPGDVSGKSDCSGDESVGSAAAFVVAVVDVAVVVEVDVEVDVDIADVDVGLDSNMVPTTANRVASRSHEAQMSGSEGWTLNRPTPLLQQFGLWSQQYDVSLFVTFSHDIRSVPPVSAASPC